MAFNQTLNRYVKDHHLNKTSIAQDMGMEGWKLNAIINGTRKMDVDEFEKFCKVAEVNPIELLNY